MLYCHSLPSILPIPNSTKPVLQTPKKEVQKPTKSRPPSKTKLFPRSQIPRCPRVTRRRENNVSLKYSRKGHPEEGWKRRILFIRVACALVPKRIAVYLAASVPLDLQGALRAALSAFAFASNGAHGSLGTSFIQRIANGTTNDFPCPGKQGEPCAPNDLFNAPFPSELQKLGTNPLPRAHDFRRYRWLRERAITSVWRTDLDCFAG